MPQPLPLALASLDGPAPPAGLVLPRAGAAAFLLQIEQRLPHYHRLKLASTRDSLILLAPEGEVLPWHENVRLYLRRQGPAFLPVDARLDLPARWHDLLVERLAAQRDLPLPLLFLPGKGGGLAVLSLAQARPLGDVDLPRLAGECLA